MPARAPLVGNNILLLICISVCGSGKPQDTDTYATFFIRVPQAYFTPLQILAA